MSVDIVERLRASSHQHKDAQAIRIDAADEITRLRARVEEMEETLEEIVGSGFPNREVNAWCAWCEGLYPHHYDECPVSIARRALRGETK